MRLKGKRVLVTGGAGFIGSHLVDALMREDCSVLSMDNLSNGKIENLNQCQGNKNHEFVLGSVIESSDVAKAMDGVDVVFHLACLGVRHSIKFPLENHYINAQGTLLVLEEARRAKVDKFIYCSSSEAYGTALYVPMSESHPTYPNTVYGASKLAGEAYARAYYKTYGLKTVVIRPFNTYGPRSHHEQEAGEMIPKSIVRVLNNRPILIFGNGSQTRDYTYVEDIAKGLIMAAKCDEATGLTLNLGTGFEISIKKIAEMILEMSGVCSPKIKYLKNRPGDVLRLYADSSALNRLTRWKPEVAFEDGLLKTIAWFRSRPEPISTLFAQEKAINWE